MKPNLGACRELRKRHGGSALFKARFVRQLRLGCVDRERVSALSPLKPSSMQHAHQIVRAMHAPARRHAQIGCVSFEKWLIEIPALKG